jgi:DNA-binding cell septation regulator SpoVG
MEKEILEVNITPINPKGSLLAFGSCVLNNLCLTSIAIHQRKDGKGIRIVYPARKVGDKNFNYFYPIKAELNNALTEAFDKKIKELKLFETNGEE